MYAFLLVIHILASIFLILVILLQAGRGGGLSESFGGGAMQNIFGSSSTTVLTKITAACAVIFILTSLTLTILTSRRGKSLIDLERSKVSDIVLGQKQKVAARQEPSKGIGLPSSPQAPEAAAQAEAGKTVTVREVRIDPATGKEIVVKEEKMTPEEAAQRNMQTTAPPAETAQPGQAE